MSCCSAVMRLIISSFVVSAAFSESCEVSISLLGVSLGSGGVFVFGVMGGSDIIVFRGLLDWVKQKRSDKAEGEARLTRPRIAA
jgi:hypothetical protein